MKRGLILILCVVAFCGGCKKDSHAPDSGGYLPLTEGSQWRYSYGSDGGTTDTLTIRMTGGTKKINGKTYYNATSTYKKGTTDGYFYAGNHTYATRTTDIASGTTLELQLLNDTASVGYSWITLPNDNGIIGNLTARTLNTIKEKNISRTVNGKTFDNVTHTQVELQYDFGSGFQTSITYDFYLAKGVGMIENDSNTLNVLYEKETLFDYTVK